MRLDPEGRYTVVAGGPSIETLDLSAYRYGTVVCVNRAFYRFPEYCDIWSVMERHAVEMFDTMPDPDARKDVNREENRRLIRGYKPTLWIPKHAKGMWTKFLPELAIKGPKAPLALSPWDTKEWPIPNWKSRVDWKQGSTMMTLSRLIRNGAEHIRVLGCDQRGVGGWKYAAAEKGRGVDYSRARKVYPQGWWTRRWERERDALELAVDECGAHGVYLEHIQPEGAACGADATA